MYKYDLDTRQQKVLKYFSIGEDEFKMMFGTADTENINDAKTGFLPDSIFNNAVLTFNKLKPINSIFERIGRTLIHYNVELKGIIVQCYRSYNTYLRLKEEGLKPSATSQHFDAEAVDVHIYHKNPITGTRYRIISDPNIYVYKLVGAARTDENRFITTKVIFDRILEELTKNKDVLQIAELRVYNWGFHIGFESTKRAVTHKIVDVRS